MELSVPTNFDDELILGLKDYPVDELYGKLASDFIGGGRASYLLSPTTKKQVEKHVQLAKKNNIGFNYLLNATCLNNQEITRQGQKKIRSILDWIAGIGVSAVTVSNPLLLRMIKNKYPHLRVRISVFAGVDHVLRAKYWEDMGADVIALDSQTVNREFKVLEALNEKISCDFELMANGACIQSCPFTATHGNLQAHGSQSKHQNGGFLIDYCAFGCSKLKLKEPVNFIRADWIRPEDLHHYEKLGFNRFKLVERNLPTPTIIQRVKAYAERKYDGNLLDIFNYQGQNFDRKQKRWMSKFFFRPTKVNLFKMKPFKRLAEIQGMYPFIKTVDTLPVLIDNRKLDGFIDRFLTKSCRDVDCNECKYCQNWTEKAVKVDAEYQDECISCYNEIDHLIESGKLFYLPSA